MEVLPVRVRGLWHDLQDSLWLLPAVGVVAAVVLAQVLVAVPPAWTGRLPGILAYSASPEGARTILGELAGATFTVVGVVFSLTVVALQMAASQFTPRILRTFLKDRSVQVVLSGMISSGVFHVTVLRHVRTPGDGTSFVPDLAVSAALLLALVTVGLLVHFLHRLTSQLRVDVAMNGIRRQTLQQVEALPLSRDRLPDRPAPQPPPGAEVVMARKSGYVETVDLGQLARFAEQQGRVVLLRPRPGEWVAEGTTIAWTWFDGDAERPGGDAIEEAIHRSYHLGDDRTEADDVAYGIRQLVDIAVRALSPGVNDPTTAVEALAQLSSILVRLADRPLGAAVVVDGAGRVRAAQPRPTFGDCLDLALAQPRRYAAAEPVVLVAALRLLVDVAERVADSGDRAELVRVQAGRVRDLADLADPADVRAVATWCATVEATLEHGVRPAGLPA